MHESATMIEKFLMEHNLWQGHSWDKPCIAGCYTIASINKWRIAITHEALVGHFLKMQSLLFQAWVDPKCSDKNTRSQRRYCRRARRRQVYSLPEYEKWLDQRV